MPERWSAALMAWPPSVTAGRSLKAPPNFPMGVRAPSTITDEVMVRLLLDRNSHPFYGSAATRLGGLLADARIVGEHQDVPVPLVLPALQRLVDDLEDLLAHQLVTLDQRVPQRRHQVAVLG